MIATNKANSILDNLLREYSVTTGTGDKATTTTYYRYLGFSSTLPTINNTDKSQPNFGIIENFTEPDKDTTGYRRLKMSEDNLSALTAADKAEITNSEYNLSFPVPNKGQEYGKAVAIGFFESDTAEHPYYTAELKEEVTLGPKSTLVIYKDDFSVKLASAKAQESSTG